MGIGRQYIDKVRRMDDDEKQELMKGFPSFVLQNFSSTKKISNLDVNFRV